MPASSPNPEAGRRLRAARERLGLSTRDVERLSRAFAETKQNQEYYISHAWLSQIEKGELTPGIYKTYTLSTIYQYRFDEVLAFFGIQLGDLGREQLRQPLPLTRLVGGAGNSLEIPQEQLEDVELVRTDLVSRMFSGLGRLQADLFPQPSSGSSVYGYVGTKDFTLFPLIRPGSFVEIDSSQRRIESARWDSVYERPIYFTELRNEYACSWCEEKDGSLLLIPYPQSGCRVREFRTPAQAEVVGRVTAVTMRIVEPIDRRVGAATRS
jgi:transcriptional regulator with XRE-family HTH domain